MHLNLKRNSKMLDVDKLKNDFYPAFCFHICFLIEKIIKGKKATCQLVRTHLLADRFFGSTLKMLAKEATYFDVFYVQYIETRSSTWEKKCCLI